MSDICQQSPIDIDYPESDWEHLHQTDFTFDAAEATREEDLQRLQHYIVKLAMAFPMNRLLHGSLVLVDHK